MARSRPGLSMPLAVLFVFLVVGCLPSTPPVDRPVTSVDDYFRELGVVFTPSDPLPGSVNAADVVKALRQNGIGRGMGAAPAIFGVLTCPGGRPFEGCEHLMGTATRRPIWVVTYPGTPTSSGSGTAYVLADAMTGAAIVFNGPTEP